jgi:hypothetical protein
MNSSLYVILPATIGPAVYSASNRNEYQKMILDSRARLVRMSDNLTAICGPVV